MRTAVQMGAARSRVRRALWSVFAAGLFLQAFFAVALYGMVEWDMSYHGLPLGEALWAETTRRATVMVLLLGVLLSSVLTVLVVGTPRSRTLREVRVDRVGLELITHPKWWYPGSRAVIPWEDVEVISAPHAIVRERVGRSTRRVAREALDLHLCGGVDDLPDFAASVEADEALEDAGSAVRIGGPGEERAAAVRELAKAIDRVRPDLFYGGTAIDQWFLPTPIGSPASGGSGLSSGSPGADPPVGAPRSALPAALWLDFRMPPVRTFAVLLGLVALIVLCYVPLHLLIGSDGIVFALLALVIMVPLGFGVVGTLLLLLALPRLLRRTGVLIDAEGIELVGKRRRHPAGAGRIPWSAVQAIVARESAVGGGFPSAGPVVDIYLHEDTSFQQPVGLPLQVARLKQPDSAYMRDLIGFPAVRLRFRHVPAAEKRAAAEKQKLLFDSCDPQTLPGALLKASLYLARPDLCHGFTPAPVDLDELNWRRTSPSS